MPKFALPYIYSKICITIELCIVSFWQKTTKHLTKKKPPKQNSMIFTNASVVNSRKPDVIKKQVLGSW